MKTLDLFVVELEKPVQDEIVLQNGAKQARASPGVGPDRDTSIKEEGPEIHHRFKLFGIHVTGKPFWSVPYIISVNWFPKGMGIQNH